MARVLIVVDDDTVGLASKARSLLGSEHDYEVLAVAPRRRTPWLDDATVEEAQAENNEHFAEVAEREAAPVHGTAEVRDGHPPTEIFAAAVEHHADIVVLGSRHRGLLRRITGRSSVDPVLAQGPWSVLLVPAGPER